MAFNALSWRTVIPIDPSALGYTFDGVNEFGSPGAVEAVYPEYETILREVDRNGLLPGLFASCKQA